MNPSKIFYTEIIILSIWEAQKKTELNTDLKACESGRNTGKVNDL